MAGFQKFAVLALVSAFGLASPAHAVPAAPFRTYVSNAGADSGNCTATSPCASLEYAHGVVAAGGEIVVLNSGFYGYVSVTKSLTIRAENGHIPVTAAISVNASASDYVAIEGLSFNLHISSSSEYGWAINVVSAGDVLISNCRISQPLYYGIGIRPNTGGTRVTVSQTTITKAGQNGILVDGYGGGAGHLKLFDSLLIGNALAGVSVTSTGNDAIISGTKILGSPRAIALGTGGVARSYGDNIITSGDAPAPVAKN